MGKLPFNPSSASSAHSPHCKDQDAPICGNTACNINGSSFHDNHHEQQKKLKLPRTSISTSTLLPSLIETTKETTTRTDSIRSLSSLPTLPKEHIADNDESKTSSSSPPASSSSSVKELVIIGAGPHALTLLLRLLEPDPDFLSEDKRHRLAESTTQMRPIRQVKQHIKDLSRRSKSTNTAKSRRTLKPKKQNRNSHRKQGLTDIRVDIPPPLSLETVLDSIQVVDANGDWLASWKQNFEAIGIPKLRSLVNAHADPYDHRSLEYYAEINGREDELVTLDDLTQRDTSFRGPYQVPTTRLFHDFHDALVHSYGIQDVVQQGRVVSITPMKDGESDENMVFEVQICNGDCNHITTVRSRRCVCALGPNFSRREHAWETDLRKDLGSKYEYISKRILRSDEIVQWLLQTRTNMVGMEPQTQTQSHRTDGDGKRVLIVGGGITSVQLTLRAFKASWCQSVVFIQRSQKLLRHFDVENAWMGPKRGKLLDEFFSMQMNDRAHSLQDARKGGSIPPELLKELERLEEKNSNLVCKEEVEISQVDWMDDEDEFHVMLNDGTATEVDYIWLATGCDNIIDRYPLLNNLRETLPIDVINGMPALSQDLSWSRSRSSNSEAVDNDGDEDECKWKQLARKRLYCVGALAGLQLGADALNIVGARHGAIKVAKAIRCDMNVSHDDDA
jgi:hypothetical protein